MSSKKRLTVMIARWRQKALRTVCALEALAASLFRHGKRLALGEFGVGQSREEGDQLFRLGCVVRQAVLGDSLIDRPRRSIVPPGAGERDVAQRRPEFATVGVDPGFLEQPLIGERGIGRASRCMDKSVKFAPE